MKNLTIQSVADAVGGRICSNHEYLQQEISMVAIDSRKIEKGGLFVAVKGERSDGHDYIGACFDAGAAAVISEREMSCADGPVIVVESTLKALKDLAAFYRSQLDVTVVGITGSVGKTSTKETVASVLSTKYRVLKTAGNFNNEIGLPLTVFRMTEEDEVAVLEMGISDFGEMSRLTAIARPDIAVITNIGQCHLEKLGTRDGILKAKTEIFEGMGANGIAVLNADDDKLITVEQVCGRPPVHFGIDDHSGVYAKDIKSNGLLGTQAVLCNVPCDDGTAEFPVDIKVPGAHMVYNALAAAAVGALLGLTERQIADGIAGMSTIAGRNNIIRTEHFLVSDDCYNANPVSMKSSIDVIALADGRKVCILGDMFELGKDEVSLHYEVGSYVADKGIDVLLTAGKLARSIADGARDANSKLEIHSFDTRDELIGELGGILRDGDNILVKASHGMEFTAIVKFLKDY